MDQTKVQALLDAQDWGEISAALYDFALGRCAPEGRAQVDVRAQAADLSQEAIVRVYGKDSKWDPEKEPDLRRYLMSVVNSLLANQRRSAAAKRNVSLSRDRTQADAEGVADSRAVPEEVVVKVDLFARRIALLKERLVGDAEALQILELTIAGADTPADLRKATGWSDKVLLAAQRRMLRCGAGVARDIGGADEEPLPRLDEAVA